MERQFDGVVRRRSRVLAAAVLGAALLAGWVAVDQGLQHRRVLALPTLLDRASFSDSELGLVVEAPPSGKLLAALAAAGRAGTSLVEVGAAGRHGAGFVAWTDARHSYVLTARPVVVRLLKRGRRNLVVRAGSVRYAGRLIAADTANQLAVVRVRGRVARGVLSSPPGKLEPGRVAVTVSLRGRKRVQPVELHMATDVLHATGDRPLPIGTPVLLLNGHPGGIVVRGGRRAVVLPLAHCRTRERCFGPTLP